MLEAQQHRRRVRVLHVQRVDVGRPHAARLADLARALLHVRHQQVVLVLQHPQRVLPADAEQVDRPLDEVARELGVGEDQADRAVGDQADVRAAQRPDDPAVGQVVVPAHRLAPERDRVHRRVLAHRDRQRADLVALGQPSVRVEIPLEAQAGEARGIQEAVGRAERVGRVREAVLRGALVGRVHAGDQAALPRFDQPGRVGDRERGRAVLQRAAGRGVEADHLAEPRRVHHAGAVLQRLGQQPVDARAIDAGLAQRARVGLDAEVPGGATGVLALPRRERGHHGDAAAVGSCHRVARRGRPVAHASCGGP